MGKIFLQTVIGSLVGVFLLSIVMPLPSVQAAPDDSCPLSATLEVSPSIIGQWSDPLTATAIIRRNGPAYPDYCSTTEYFKVEFFLSESQKLIGMVENVQMNSGSGLTSVRPSKQFKLTDVTGFDVSKTSQKMHAVIGGYRSSTNGNKVIANISTTEVSVKIGEVSEPPPAPAGKTRMKLILANTFESPNRDPQGKFRVGRLFSFTLTPEPGNPAVKEFVANCGPTGLTDKPIINQTKDFKCEFPNGNKEYKITLRALDASGKDIGPPAELEVKADDGGGSGGGGGTEPSDRVKQILNFHEPVKSTLPELFNRAIAIMFGLIASISVIFIIVGGFRLAFSQGNAETVTAARKTITWAVIGLVVGLMAFALIRIVERILYS
jgi:hypothetical protein